MYFVDVCCQRHQSVQVLETEGTLPKSVRLIELFAEALDVWPFARFPPLVAEAALGLRQFVYFHCVVIAEVIWLFPCVCIGDLRRQDLAIFGH